MAKGKYHRWLTPEGLILIQGWARDGLTDEEIAHKMGVTRKTFYEWVNRFGDIRDAIKSNKEIADREVEQALFKKAMGTATVREIVKERVYNPVTRQYELAVVKETEKTIPPDTAAQVFWLKNRKPDTWRDKREVVTDNIAELGDIDELTGKIFGAEGDRDLNSFLDQTEGDGNE